MRQIPYRKPKHDNIKLTTKAGKVHEFKLGMGPCGRWVATLTVNISNGVVTIRQVSYSKDITQHLELFKPGRHFTSLERLEYDVAVRELKEDCEVKNFVYPLTEIVGRLHYTEV